MPEEKDIPVVDDEPIIRDILVRKLKSSGYRPVAVEKASAFHYYSHTVTPT